MNEKMVNAPETENAGGSGKKEKEKLTGWPRVKKEK